MKKLIAALLVLLSYAEVRAQTQQSGYVATPSATQSIIGQATVAMTNATCNVVTPGSACTVSGLVASYLAAYVGTYNLTGSLTSPQNLVVPLQPGAVHWVANGTGQVITVGGATGAAVQVGVGSSTMIYSPDGANYVGTGLGTVDGNVFVATTLYGNNVCWHYEQNPPTPPAFQAACLMYAGHGTYYGPYTTQDGMTFQPTSFSVGQLQIGGSGVTGATGQDLAPSILFYPGDTAAVPAVNAIGAISMFQTQPIGACPAAGTPGTNPEYGFGPDNTLSFCSNAPDSVWQTTTSSGGGISGSGATGIVPIWTGSTALGESPIDLGVTLANNLTIYPPNNNSIQVLSSGTGTTTITAGSGVDINSSTGNVRIESVASGGTVQVITDGNAQNMSFPSPGFTGTVGVLEGSTTATHYIEVAADGVGLQDGGSALSTVATTGNINDTIGVTTPGRIPVNVANGVNFWGNSECADVGANPSSLGWASRFVSTYMVGAVNNVTTRRCLTGSFSADAINFGALLRQTNQVSLVPFVMPSYGAPLTFGQSLENDANNNIGLNAALQMASKEQDLALIALGTAPLDQQIQATNAGWTCTGTQAGDDYYGSILPGTILNAGQTCSISIVTTAAPDSTASNPIDMLYTIFAGDNGTGTVTIDGAPATDTITGAQVLVNAPFGGAALLTSAAFTRTLALARFVPTTTGTHTVSVAGVTTGTNGFGLQSIFTTPVGIPSYAAPTFIKTGVLRQRLDAAAAATAAYDTMSKADCIQMASDGFRCIAAPSREPFITQANLEFMMSNVNVFTAGAVNRTNLTFTAGSTVITSATNFGASYVKDLVICTDGLTASTDYAGTVTSWTSTNPTQISVTPALGNSSGAGTGQCSFGTNSQVTLASSSPGLHPSNAGHDAELQGILSVVQPVQLPPIAPGFTNFTLGMATNAGQSSGIFNMNYANNTPAALLTSAPYCGVLFGSNSNAITGVNIAGTCFSRDTVKSQFFTGIVSQFNNQVKIGDNNANTYQNGSFRWDFVFDNSAGGANGNTDQGMFFNNGLDSYTITTLPSAATLQAPASKFINVTGTAAISAIPVPPGSASLGPASSSPALSTYKGCINFIASGGTAGTNAWSVTAGSTILTGFQAVFGQQYQGCYDGTNWRFTGPGIGGLSGMTASQIPIAATATTVTSSKAIAGSGAGLTSGPTSATATDVPVFTSTTGGLVDSGVLLSSLCQTSGTNCPALYSLGGTLSNSNVTVESGAGTGASASIQGLDGSHLLTITTGIAPSNLTYAIVNFTASRGHITYCVASPTNQPTALLVGTSSIYFSSTSAFDYAVNIAGVPLAASTLYQWDVSCP